MIQDAPLYEYSISFHFTRKEGTSITFGSFRATVYAENEAEVRQILEEEEPGACLDSCVRGALVDE